MAGGVVTGAPPTPFERWRLRARRLLEQRVPPEQADWTGASLFAANVVTSGARGTDLRIPAALVDLLDRAACHRHPAPDALLYRLLWRVLHEGRGLLADAADDDVIAVRRMAKAVDRASHKMQAFVRFRAVESATGPRYVARFDPEHDVLARTAPFFAARFAGMHWTIVTPDGGVQWDGRALAYFDVRTGVLLPDADAAEALWLTYFESIFNPARLNVAMMRKEMPVRYWQGLPEAARIPALVQDAAVRTDRMIATAHDVPRAAWAPPARAVGAEGSTASLEHCRRCPLWEHATQAVPGAGPASAALMLVGEQPGDEEDLAGTPFVGPAGRLLHRALALAGIAAADVYITNAVKHFSFVPRGKRRIHKTPAQREIAACSHWLEGEIARVRPRVVVALGATALSALVRTRIGVAAARGQALVHDASGAAVVATYHPAAVLREPDADVKRARYDALVDDLRGALTAAQQPA